MNTTLFRPIDFLLFLIILFLVNACAEKPGDPATTGLKQYIGDGFVIKYPDSAQLDLKGANEQALRTVTLTGHNIELDIASGKIEMPTFQILIEWYENQEHTDAASFAQQLILSQYQQALVDDAPTRYWPVDESGEVKGRAKKVHGATAWESEFLSGDHKFVRTYIANRDKVISVGYRKYPIENNPIQPAWEVAYIFTLDSIRLLKD